jgi:hypothetical protein
MCTFGVLALVVGLGYRVLSRPAGLAQPTIPKRQETFHRPLPRGEAVVDPLDTGELDAIYAEANTSVDAARTPAQKLEVGLGLRTRLMDFAAARPKSAYSPSVRLEVVRLARDRLGYSDSVEQALAAFDEVKTATDPRAREMAREAATELVHLLSITSRYADQKAVEEEAGP